MDGLSLLFWFWVWGPVGALLAVPLTMVVKIMLENTEDLRWVAILLDKSSPQMVAGLAVPGSPESATAGSIDGPDVAEPARDADTAPDATAADAEVVA